VPCLVIVLIIVAAILLFGYLNKPATAHATPLNVPSHVPHVEAPSPSLLPTRGTFHGDLVLVVGRTGAGKSSVINMLKGQRLLPVGDVGSTTRWLEGVPLRLNGQSVTFVDSPGVGEAFTDADYSKGILEWYWRNAFTARCFVLVLQADAKAHADDGRLIEALRVIADKPLLIVLNQVDKIKPARETIADDSWATYRAKGTAKSRHIDQKMRLVAEQFRRPGMILSLVPVVSESGHFFSREQILRILLAHLRHRS
jgi:predicted GTPase